MKIEQINNQPSFGIKYLNKSAWNPTVLKTFENSKLLKNIDKKYPSATVTYKKIYEEDIFGSEPTHTLVAVFNLAKNMIYRWSLSSYRKDIPEKNFIDFINSTTLSEIEFKAVPELSAMTQIEINKRKTVKNFFEDIFRK